MKPFDYMEHIDEVPQTHKEKREEPIYVHDIENKHDLVDLAACTLMLWEPIDIRIDGRDAINMDLRKFVMSMETQLGEKFYEDGIFEYFVETQSNVDEFERFNAFIKKHNEKALNNRGMTGTTIHPITGEKIQGMEGYVNVCMDFESKYYYGEIQEPGDGPISSKRPVAKLKPIVKVTYQVKIIGDKFRLGYVAEDLKGLITYYNQIEGENLAQLIRRSVQEIWGNPNAIQGNRVDKAQGVPMLIHGHKIAQCQRDNTKPEFMDELVEKLKTQIKTSNPELERKELDEVASEFVEASTGYFLPVILLIIFLVGSFWSWIHWGNDGEGAGARFVATMVALIVVSLIGRKTSQLAARRASVIRHEKPLI